MAFKFRRFEMKKNIVLSLLFIFIVPFIFQADIKVEAAKKKDKKRGNLYGQITSISGSQKKIKGVKVSIKGTKISTRTNKKGKFVLKNLPVGDNILTFQQGV